MSTNKKTQKQSTIVDVCTQEISRKKNGRSNLKSNISNSEIMENPSIENEIVSENNSTILENQKNENAKENTLRSLTIDNYKKQIKNSKTIAELERQIAAAKLTLLVDSLHNSVINYYSTENNISVDDMEKLWNDAINISVNFQYDFVSSVADNYEMQPTEEKLTCGNKLRYKVINPATKPVEIVARFNSFMEYARLAELPSYKPFKIIEDRAKATDNVNKVVASALESLSVEEIQRILAAKLGI